MKKRISGIKKRIIYLIHACSLVTFFYLYNPAEILYPPCPFYYLTGLYCPGCGTSRAIHQLLHGKFLYALNLNPLMVISLPFIFYLLMCSMGIRFKGRVIFKRIVFSKSFYGILLTVIAVYWITRNVPVFPFSTLAP